MSFQLITKEKLILLVTRCMDTFHSEVPDTIDHIKFVFTFNKNNNSFVQYAFFVNNTQTKCPELVKIMHRFLSDELNTFELPDDNRCYEHTLSWTNIKKHYVHYVMCVVNIN